MKAETIIRITFWSFLALMVTIGLIYSMALRSIGQGKTTETHKWEIAKYKVIVTQHEPLVGRSYSEIEVKEKNALLFIFDRHLLSKRLGYYDLDGCTIELSNNEVDLIFDSCKGEIYEQ